MSHFITIAGGSIDMEGFEPIELIPIEKLNSVTQQSYFVGLIDKLKNEDGWPIYFAHDGDTWTSTGILGAAVDTYYKEDNNSLEGSALLYVINAAASKGCTIRIWMADDDPKAYLNVHTYTNKAELMSYLENEIGRIGFGNFNVRLRDIKFEVQQ